MANELKELKRQVRLLQNTFDGVRRFVDKFKKEKNYGQISTRLDMLETAMEKFYALRRKIDQVSESIDEKTVSESKESPEERTARLEVLSEQRCQESAEVIQETEDVYCELRSSLLSLRGEPNPGSANAPQQVANPTSTVKLPELRLPNFGGRLREWITFRDMFQSLVHCNRQLSDMDKFSYLRSSLVGEALQEVGTLEMTSANYAIAWDLLQKRYENKKLIVKAHLDALFAVESMKRESYEALNHLISEYDRNLQMMAKIGEETANWSTILVHMVCSRLDPTTLRYWESHHCSKEVPKYDDLISFLRNQCSVLQSIAPEKSTHTDLRKPKASVSHPSTQSSYRCPFCGEAQHSAFKCQRFLKMKVSERYEKVKKCGLCLNCFSSSHLARLCTKGFCQHCQRKHHTLLHFTSSESGAGAASSQTGSSVPPDQPRAQRANNQQTQPHAKNQTPSQNTGPNTSSFPIASTSSHPHPPPPTTDRTPSQNTNSLPINTHTSSRQVLLSTALVRITDQYGNMQLARALLDSCSEYCFITRNLCQKLKLAGSSNPLSIVGIGGSSTKSTRMVSATVMPRSLKISPYSENIQLHVLPKLTSDLPTEQVNVQQLAIPEHMTLADPTFFEPGSIDLIIGAEYYYDLLADGKVKLFDDGPTLQETVFGWVISGRVPGSSLAIPRTVSYPCTTSDLNDLLTKFWELESCNSRGTLSVEESTCEEIFERTTIRDEAGRFVVTLPKKEAVIQKLGDSKASALKRFYGLERRFAANTALKEAYFEFINEYESMGHMEEVTDGEDPVYYLPHHAVLKPDSTTTKLRVVFDASCRTSTGVSLNDGLMVGPVVQDDLQAITLRFRFWKYAFVADVAKMYRMVKTHFADHLLQCILWRPFPGDPVKAYKLTTVTYGTSSAPYLATKCLQRLGTDGEATHPAAAKIVKKDFYVDDLLSGTDDLEEGKSLVMDLIDLTNSAGFILRKWSSNSAELLSSVPSELRDERISFELDSSTSVIKTLGLVWEPSTDVFRFTVPKLDSDAPITKRTVLSDSAKIFDPLGVIGPVVVQAKIFLQTLWKQKCDWDELLPEELQNTWMEFRRNLLALDTLTVPRWVSFSPNLATVELHGFCDASNAAYGACLYLRCITATGEITVRLITAKSRVTPLEDLKRKKKVLSTPRLELSAALLLSHLYEKVCSSIQIPLQSFFWTDSTIVKYWLASPPSRWQIFVANRVSEIQHITSSGVWNHVAGADNPADIISRGMTPAQLKYETAWFEGPLWLRQDRSMWPINSCATPDIEQSLLEERSTVALPVRAKKPSEIFSLRSSFTDLVRIVAYIRRFLHNTSPNNRNNKRSGPIQLQELNEATEALVRLAQEDSFPEEVATLSRGREVKTSSKILSLHPILVDKTLRVGGRLAHAPITESRKHPMILHHHHPLTKLVLQHYHVKHFHAGQQLLIASVREKFWPTNARDLARTVCHQCVTCFRNKPTVHEQLMADLPSARVNPAAVFLKVGVDLCGPFYIKYPVRRSVAVKCFVAIFVCLATKAVHMEVVADLSTQAFLAAFKRFVAVRGKPQVVMCDNATNFVGANKELEELRLQFLDQQFQHTVVRTAEDEGIRFEFIPARSPNFGGLWEAAVKSFKGHFRKVVGNQQLSYDQLYTIVQQVAAILNSRPLTPLSNDPNDYAALTPGHFLVGRPLTAIPEPDLQEVPENRLSIWQQSQDFVQKLWRKWKTHYLSDLHNRTKWTKKRDNIKIDTMVLVKEDYLPPQRWKLGRVAEIFTGSDGNVRVVNVRTKDGLFKRAISKICVLPIKDNAPTDEEH